LDPLKEHLWSFRSSALLEQGCDLAPVGLLRRGARCVVSLWYLYVSPLRLGFFDFLSFLLFLSMFG